jgi:hypothetical protein
MKLKFPVPLALVFIAGVLLAAGCASSRGFSYYKTVLADPHPYPVSVIRTESKPAKQGNEYLFSFPDGIQVKIPAQYVARVEQVREERDKNDRDLFESKKPSAYKPSKEYFRGPFEFRN